MMNRKLAMGLVVGLSMFVLVSSIIVLVLALGGGFVIGEELSRWRASKLTREETAAKIVTMTRPNLPAALGGGWSFADIHATDSGVAIVCRPESAVPLAPEAVDAAVDAIHAPLSARLCGNRWAKRLAEKGGTIEARYVVGAGDSRTRHIAPDACDALQ